MRKGDQKRGSPVGLRNPRKIPRNPSAGRLSPQYRGPSAKSQMEKCSYALRIVREGVGSRTCPFRDPQKPPGRRHEIGVGLPARQALSYRYRTPVDGAALVAETYGCQAAHKGYVLSGRQIILMDDGTALEIHAGDIFSIPAGHDGWKIGSEPSVVPGFSGWPTTPNADRAGPGQMMPPSSRRVRTILCHIDPLSRAGLLA